MFVKIYFYYLVNCLQFLKMMLDVCDKYSGKVVICVVVFDVCVIEKVIVVVVQVVFVMCVFKLWQCQVVLQYCVVCFEVCKDELVCVLCIEVGKLIKDVVGEVIWLIEIFQIVVEEVVCVNGEMINLELVSCLDGYCGYICCVLLGLVSFIMLFNFLFNFVVYKVVLVIVVGCLFVFKLLEKMLIGVLIIGEVLVEIDLLKGVFLILLLDGVYVMLLVEDECFKLFFFIGGQIGWEFKVCVGCKKVMLELGGNVVCIVDVDQGDKFDYVVEWLVFGVFYQFGQSCISVQCIYVYVNVYDVFKCKLVVVVKKFKVGDFKKRDVFFGLMIDEVVVECLYGWIVEVCQVGVKLLCGGKCDGVMFEVMLMEDVLCEVKVNCMEVFGLFVLFVLFCMFEEVVVLVNDLDFGLQVGIFINWFDYVMCVWDELE